MIRRIKLHEDFNLLYKSMVAQTVLSSLCRLDIILPHFCVVYLLKQNELLTLNFFYKDFLNVLFLIFFFYSVTDKHVYLIPQFQ